MTSQGYVGGSRAPFLSTLTPGRGQRRIAGAVVLLSLVLMGAVAPFAKLPLEPVAAFLPIYQSALVVVNIITMTLLLGQFAILRTRGLLVLACAYLFGGLMAMAHAASFPGLFVAGGLLGGSQVTAWLYFFWHAAFPVFLGVYAMLKQQPGVPASRSLALEILVALTLTVLAATLAAHAAQLLADRHPLMRGSADDVPKLTVAALTWLVGVAMLLVLWLRRPHSVIDLWLMVALCVWVSDTALAALFNAARYDVGWYAGRVYGLLASSFVLGVLLLENSVLYARLVEASDAQRRRASELQRLTTELEAANRDLDAFAGGLAHDLQQPVTTIGAFAQLIQRQSGHLLTESSASHLRRIIVAAGAAHAMIHGLLEFARLGQRKLQLQTVDLDGVVRNAREMLAADTDLAAVDWHVGPLPQVRADASLLLLAVMNLLSNAVKYTRGQAQPRVAVDWTVVGTGGGGLRVQDNGVGFDVSQAGRLFRPFERLHANGSFPGTGMGLANVRRIMERHGGTVQAHSVPGQGAAFTLVFPAVDGNADVQGTGTDMPGEHQRVIAR